MQIAVEKIVRNLLNEAVVHRKWMIGAFVTINMLFLAIGLVWPKSYIASTTILATEKNIIQPLMQGAAVATDAVDRAKLAREVIYGRKVMNQILQDAGWLADNPSPVEQERIIERLTKQTEISNVGQNIIKIQYKDDNAERAYRTTQRLADLFLQESSTTKSAESKAAFDFIDAQVQEYHAKLANAEEQLKIFRTDNIDSRPGTAAEIGTRISTLQNTLEQTLVALKEAKIKQISIEKQLSGEAESTVAFSREGQYRTRIAELQSQLDTLRLSYQENYPDVVRIKHQIDDLKENIVTERRNREAARSAGQAPSDETLSLNPLYQQLKRDLSTTKVEIDTLKTRLDETNRLLETERTRARKVHGGEATVAELTRDYEVNRDIYQDLIRRRENARVSMNLDVEQQGLTFRIHEPAILPLQPSGLRFLHFALGGLFLGLIAPFGALYGIQQVDPRIRFDSILSEKIGVPVIGNIPHLATRDEIQVMDRSLSVLLRVLAVNGAVFIAVVVARMAKWI